MGESGKASLAVLFMLCAGTAAVVWSDTQPSAATWAIRWSATGVGTLSISLLLWSMWRRDRVPDFLRQLTRRFFERDGFCFVLVPKLIDGRAKLLLFYQNRYERSCRAQVVLTFSHGFFLTRAHSSCLNLGVECDGGEFGVLTVDWQEPVQLHGASQSFDVSANVEYPFGHGRMLRFRDGMRVGKAGVDGFRLALTVAAAATGHIHISRPARVSLMFPTGTAEATPTEASIHRRTLWSLHDPTLPQVPTAE